MDICHGFRSWPGAVLRGEKTAMTTKPPGEQPDPWDNAPPEETEKSGPWDNAKQNEAAKKTVDQPDPAEDAPKEPAEKPGPWDN